MKFNKSSEKCMDDAQNIEKKLSVYPTGYKLTRDELKCECMSELLVDERTTLNIWLSSEFCTWEERTICHHRVIQVGFVRVKV